jgi:hypothetical protein
MRDFAPAFGYLIGYGLPGFIALAGFGFAVPVVGAWFTEAGWNGPIYVSIASLTLGVFLSGVRYVLVDCGIFRILEVQRPKDINYARIMVHDGTARAMSFSVEHSYRHFLFYGNSAVAALVFYAGRLAGWPVPDRCSLALEALALLLVEAFLIVSARSAFANYCDDLTNLNDLAGARENKEHG